MGDQNLKNHARYIPLWHVITPIVLVVLLIGSIRNVVLADKSELYSATLILLITVLLFIYYWYTRAFALKAQDRAIRAEETFRHFVLTGKPLDRKLRMGQIVALRFASDAEFVTLAQRAVAENLTSKEIKQAIQNWKGDYYRV